MGFQELLLEDADSVVWRDEEYSFSSQCSFPFFVLNIADGPDGKVVPCLLWSNMGFGVMHSHLYGSIRGKHFSTFGYFAGGLQQEAKKALESPNTVVIDMDGVGREIDKLNHWFLPETVGRVFVPPGENTVLLAFHELNWQDFKPFLTHFLKNPPIFAVSKHTERVSRCFIQPVGTGDDHWEKVPLDKLITKENDPKLDLPEVKKRIRELQTQLHLMTGNEKKKAKVEIMALARVLSGRISMEDAQELIDSAEEPEENQEAFGSWQYGKKAPLNVRQKAITSESILDKYLNT